jgi:type VI secretion system protein ImpH
MLLQLEKDAKGPEKRALRAWFDLFNHRLVSLFYRAWEKYRFYVPYERGDFGRPEADPFTQALFSLLGLGAPSLRNRLRVAIRQDVEGERRERVLARLDDLVLLYYGGFFAHRPRCAVALEALLADYFHLPVRVEQFHGQWLRLDPVNQSRLGEGAGNNQPGINLVAGERVWSAQSKFRLRLGPLRYAQFLEFLPDRAPVPQRKTFFLLCHLVRLYVGPEFDFDVQLVLSAPDVPALQLGDHNGGSPRLGWNTWVRSGEFRRDAEDAAFEGEAIVWVSA